MNDKQLRRLKRADLLEMLIEQSKEVESLKQQVQELQEKLEDRQIRIEKAGTIADAAFELNGVLAAAQAAAKQYLDNLERLNKEAENRTENKARKDL